MNEDPSACYQGYFFMLNSFLSIKTCENERLVVILQMCTVQKPDFPGQKPEFWSVWHLRIMIWRLDERRSLHVLIRVFFVLNSFLGIKTFENYVLHVF